MKVFIIFVCLGIILPHFVYAGYDPVFDPDTGWMVITLTKGHDIKITKHPTTGGLAVNGECTEVFAYQVKLFLNKKD